MMSLRSEDMLLRDDHVEKSANPERKGMISYTRDLLLQLSDLDVCKKLPDGFDCSILSEFEDTSQDRHRVSGGFSSHGFRRTEYCSSPPTRGESGNFSRGTHGRWDSRSSGRSDKDRDSQSGQSESESGRRYGSQPHRPWQAAEHDGLLGSGSFPRPPGYATGSSLPKSRSNEHYHLNKSSEPYHPPRPYKAAPHPRRETLDSYNDETFGSLECTSEDRAEEERKRRASFESMRKEQVKEIHEMQKLNPNKRKDDFDINTLLEDSSNEKRIINKTNRSDQLVKEPAVSGNSENPSLPQLQGPTCRPLVPPGFKNSAHERITGAKLPRQSDAAEVEDRHLVNMTHSSFLNNTNHDQENKQTGEKLVYRDVQKAISSNFVSTNKDSQRSSQFAEPVKVAETTELKELGAQNSTGNPPFIMDKLFGSVINDGCFTADEHLVSRTDETWSAHTVRSSKFAQWFREEDQKPVEDLSSGQTNNLHSIIVGGEKWGLKAFDTRTSEPLSTNDPIPNSELPDRHLTSTVKSYMTDNSEQLYGEGDNTPNAFLTCEDLEQKMLLEASKSGSNSSPQLQGWSTRDNTELPIAPVANQASHHLLSLLKKGASQKDMSPSLNLGVVASGNPHKIEREVNTSAKSLRNEDVEINQDLGKSLTLETLFGNAFVKELQSARAPVSVQRGSSGPVGGDTSEPARFPLSNSDNSMTVLNLIERIRPGGIEERYIGFHNSRVIADPHHLPYYSGSKPDGSGNSAEALLTEEDSLFNVGNPVNFQCLKSVYTSADIVEKLASLNSAVRDESSSTRPQDVPLLHAAYNSSSRGSDLPFDLELHPSPQVNTTELNHGGQMFYSSSPSANTNPQMKFMSPDLINQNPPSNQFTMDAFRPPFPYSSSGVTAFDQPSQHAILQQVPMPGSFPPPHMLRGFPPGVPRQPHTSNHQVAGIMPELNPAQGFPSSHLRPNYDGPSRPFTAPQLGSFCNNPEALQRLLEMEPRSKPKQIHHFPPAGHSQLDMGFGYR